MKPQMLDIFGYFFDRSMQNPCFFLRRRCLTNSTGFVDHEPPNTAQKTKDTLKSPGLPRFDHLKRPHEHFVKAHAICPVVSDELVGIDHIPARPGAPFCFFSPKY